MSVLKLQFICAEHVAHSLFKLMSANVELGILAGVWLDSGIGLNVTVVSS